MLISALRGNHFSNLSRLSALRPPPRSIGGTAGVSNGESYLQAIPAYSLQASLTFGETEFASLIRQAENGGKMEYWVWVTSHWKIWIYAFLAILPLFQHSLSAIKTSSARRFMISISYKNPLGILLSLSECLPIFVCIDRIYSEEQNICCYCFLYLEISIICSAVFRCKIRPRLIG